MVDKEKVIKGLKCCDANKPNNSCKSDCPFFSVHSTSRCKAILHISAIALLKEQEKLIEDITRNRMNNGAFD